MCGERGNVGHELALWRDVGVVPSVFVTVLGRWVVYRGLCVLVNWGRNRSRIRSHCVFGHKGFAHSEL